jgi:hypothetical protein
MTTGKKIGTIAFIFSEFISLLAIILMFYCAYKDSEMKTITDIISGLFLFQGSILTITWASKASSNFVNQNIDREKKDDKNN